MSTLTIFARGERALLLTDTAGTGPDFSVYGWVSKVATIPHLKVAITAQGAAEALGTLANRFASSFHSFDTMVKHGGNILERVYEDEAILWSASAKSSALRLALTGWSEERRRFETHFLLSHDAEGVPAFTFVRRDLVMAPELHSEDIAALQIPKDGSLFSADALAYLLRIITVQRHATTPSLTNGEPGHVIGGQVVATEMTPAGITQRVVHAWPDILKEPIRPAPLKEELAAVMQIPQQTSGPNVVAMSRQQRRAAERASK